MISLHAHLEETSQTNKYVELVLRHEESRIARVSTEFKSALRITESQKISTDAKKAIKKQHKEEYQRKSQYGYVHRNQASAENYSKVMSNKWLLSPGMTSHTEGYIAAIQEQEINTYFISFVRATISLQACIFQCDMMKLQR